MLMHSDTLLEVDGISKIYSRKQATSRRRIASQFFQTIIGQSQVRPDDLSDGEFWSLHNIRFSLKRGEALGIIGLNGAGKTTLLRILAGQLLPDRGEIRALGTTAAMIDLTAGFQMSASGRRNIYLRGAMLGIKKALIERDLEDIVAFTELGDAIDAPVSTYSSGMLMRLAFSIMVTLEPDILIVDEILSVGDFQFRQKCLAKIRGLRENSAFILVSHSMQDVKLFCDKVIVLNKGREIFHGDPDKAIKTFEELSVASQPPAQQRKPHFVGPQFHNREAISVLLHHWCDKDGNPIRNLVAGSTIYFRASFKLSHRPRNLVIGIPVWNEKGEYITGFSTELSENKIDVIENEISSFELCAPSLAFNPGVYLSTISISDGPEFLFREQNLPITIQSNHRRHWGMVSLPHSWHRR